MNTITIALSDERYAALQAVAERLDLTVEELIHASADALIEKSDKEFQESVKRVLDKNRDLYQRLA